MTAAAATAVALSSQAGAHADPAPNKDQVKAQVDQLNQQAEAATEKYDGATEQEQTLQKQVSALQDQVARQQDQVSTIQVGLGEIAADQYRNGGISPTVQLMLSSTPDSFLTQAGSMSQLSASQADALKELKSEQSKLDQQKAEAQDKLAQLDATTKNLKADKEEIQAKLAQAQALLNTLTQQERDALAAADAKSAADAAAAAKAVTASSSSADRASRGSSRPVLGNAPAGSYAAAAIAAAESRLGDPYHYGDTGPNSFDCSGLMQWSFAQAGISLPRTSEEQWAYGKDLGTDISVAQPGDLLIFEGGGHVGLYIGNGTFIHAPRAGENVRYEQVAYMNLTAIVRI
ncbi:C40 family peptidase [Kitasatospora sp. MAP5-34]|uniref:C40 family peptidase n=1 Tax=Kitasatospora sp. MAP5-34 TaxID=3035102 RepID=UPI002474496E|nr:C40 family peptidase [Kitasatospora sp. MAP5-34]